MSRALDPVDEVDRIASLVALNVLDTAPEPELDAIVLLASTFCQTPIALISLVDTDRQWFKSRLGLEPEQTSRDASFCAHAILAPETAFVVPDATKDARFADNPLVTGEPGIRFYAGIPLIASTGSAVGTLCALDRVPRNLSPQQLEALRVAAHGVMMLLEKRNAQDRLALLELVAVHADDGVAIVSIDAHDPGVRRIAYVNDAFTRLTGYSERSLAQTELGAMLLALADEPAAGASGARTFAGSGALAALEVSVSVVVSVPAAPSAHVVIILRDASETRRIAEARARADALTTDNAELQHEIIERRQAQSKLSHAASHDALTGLPNRTLFGTYLDAAVAGGGASSNGRCRAVVFIDLDHFKRINDTYGHLIGDALLVAVAKRIVAALRPADVAGRFAGDEFIVLLGDCEGASEAAALVERLSRAFAEPFRLGSHEVAVTASIGASFIAGDDASTHDVLRNADIAMFAAKENGRARAQFFTSELGERFSVAANLEASLGSAFRKHEFRLDYEPIVSLAAGDARPVGFEAHLRWSSQHGEMDPAKFLPVAEEIGLIIPLGEWMLGSACERVAACGATVSVTVSAKQFVNPQFLEQVDGALARSGIEPHDLALQFSETTLMEDVEKSAAILLALRERGVKTHVADFGTGYCSFGHLRRFAVDCLKIDPTFISGGAGVTPAGGVADPEIVRAIVTLARGLSLRTVASGVVTAAQRAELAALGCDAAQGPLFGLPLRDPSRSPATPAAVRRSS